MKQADYQAERERLEGEVEKYREYLDEAEKNLVALDRLWEKVWKKNGSTLGFRATPQPSLGSVIRAFVSNRGPDEDFDTGDIADHVKSNYPELEPDQTTLYSKPLRRMKKKGDIIQISPASGTRRAVYRRVKEMEI